MNFNAALYRHARRLDRKLEVVAPSNGDVRLAVELLLHAARELKRRLPAERVILLRHTKTGRRIETVKKVVKAPVNDTQVNLVEIA